MGFGALFIGNFLLLNIAYYEYTDLLAGLLLLLSSLKLASYERHFKDAAFCAGVFSLFGLSLFVFSILSSFGISAKLDAMSEFIRPFRYFVLAVFVYLELRGIGSLAKEVGHDKLARTCYIDNMISAPVLLLSAIFNTPLTVVFPGLVSAIIYLILTVAFLAVIFLILYATYDAYAMICLPDDSAERKKSKNVLRKKNPLLSERTDKHE